MNLIPNPESESLKKNIEALQSELTNIINDYELLINFVCRNIQDKYMTLVGNSKLELLYIECDAKRLKRKIELIQSHFNRGDIPGLQEIENILEMEMKDWYIKIYEFFKELQKAEVNIKLIENGQDNKELKRLFRKLSKILHPDINPDLQEKYKLLWLRVLEAYKNCDVEELKAIELLIETNSPRKMETFVIEELINRKKKLEDSITHYIKKIEAVKRTKPYRLKDVIENENLLVKELSEIENRKEYFQLLIEKYNIILDNYNLGGNGGFSIN